MRDDQFRGEVGKIIFNLTKGIQWFTYILKNYIVILMVVSHHETHIEKLQEEAEIFLNKFQDNDTCCAVFRSETTYLTKVPKIDFKATLLVSW